MGFQIGDRVEYIGGFTHVLYKQGTIIGFGGVEPWEYAMVSFDDGEVNVRGDGNSRWFNAFFKNIKLISASEVSVDVSDYL